MENTNTEEKLSGKELLKEVVKSSHQEAVETLKYPGIKLVSRFSRFIGIIFFVIYLVLGLLSPFQTDGFLAVTFLFLQFLATGFMWLVFGFLIGDLLQVLVDIEENTRDKK